MWLSRSPALLAEKLHQHRLDPAAERVVRISGPREARGHVKRPVERRAESVGEDDARLLGDEPPGAVVRVTAQAGRLLLDLVQQRAKVGVEPVVADDQL